MANCRFKAIVHQAASSVENLFQSPTREPIESLRTSYVGFDPAHQMHVELRPHGPVGSTYFNPLLKNTSEPANTLFT
jgi:hypothetical protein